MPRKVIRSYVNCHFSVAATTPTMGGSAIAAPGTGGVTVEAWIYVPANTPLAGFFGINIHGGGDNAFLCYSSSGVANDPTLNMRWFNGASPAGDAVKFIIFNQWMHVVLVLDPSTGHLRAYRNSVLMYDLAQTWNITATQDVASGGAPGLIGGTDGLKIVDQRTYLRALSAQEVADRYFNNRDDAAMRTSLVSQHLYGEGIGTIAADSSGNGRTMTVLNTNWKSDSPMKSRVQPQNMTLMSEALDDVAWSTNGSIVAADVLTAPDGKVTADRLTDTVANSVHALHPTANYGIVIGDIYTFSVYLKYENHALINLAGNGGDGTAYVYVNVQTGQIAGTAGANVIDCGVVSVGNGWYRAWNTFIANVNGANPTFYFAQSVGTIVYAGTGTDTMLMWGVQMEHRSTVGPYQKTTANLFGGGGQFPPVLVQGQNLLKWSEALGTAPWASDGTATMTNNFAVSPIGTNTASRVQFSGGSFQYVYSNASQPAPTPGNWTLSAWMRGTSGPATVRFRLPNVVGVSNALSADIVLDTTWRRYSHTVSITGAGGPNAYALICNDVATDAADFLVWGAQLEQRNAAGDYIRTTTAPVNASTAPRQIAMQVQNFLAWSEDLSQAATWGAVQATVVGGNLAPDGTLTAYKLTEDSTTNEHYIHQTYTFAGTVCYSVFVKPGGRDWVHLTTVSNDGTVTRTWFNVTTGVLGTIGHSNAFIASANNGYYRCSIVHNVPGVGTNGNRGIFLEATTANGATATVGDITKGVYAWGFQVEQRNAPGGYVKTTSTAVNTGTPRQIPAQLQNLVTRSEDTTNADWTTNLITATISGTDADPFGGTNANKWTDSVDGAASAHFKRQVPIGLAAGAMATMSMRVKAGTKTACAIYDGSTYIAKFNLAGAGSVASVTAGTPRASITADPVHAGWFTVSMTSPWQAGASPRFYMSDAVAVDETYQGDGTGTLFVCGLQIEQRNTVGGYAKTVGTGVRVNNGTPRNFAL